jgi:predicted ester cyclase
VSTHRKNVGIGKEEEASVSSQAEEKKALVRRYFEARVKGDVDAMDETMAPDFVNHAKQLPDQGTDREAQKWAVAKFYGAVSNASVHFEDQIVQADKVVTRLIVHATHDRGERMGVAPTGRELTFMPIAIHRIEGVKIAEQWGGGTGLSELRALRLEKEERERERIEQELLVAKRIQQASLPKEVSTLEGWEQEDDITLLTLRRSAFLS